MKSLSWLMAASIVVPDSDLWSGVLFIYVSDSCQRLYPNEPNQNALSSRSNARVIAAVLVGVIVVVALVGYGYIATSSSLSSLSEQNAGLSQQLSNQDQQLSSLNQQVSNGNQQISSLSQQVSSLQQRTLTIVTMTNTIISVQTTTSVSTETKTDFSTSTVYPVPDNVTVYLAPSGFTNYAITAGSYSASGSSGSPQRFSVSPVFQGETITVAITLSCPGSTGPSASAFLYVNSTLVSQTNVACGGNTNGQISYVL